MAAYVAQKGIDILRNMASIIHYTRDCGYLRQRTSSQYPQEHNLSKLELRETYWSIEIKMNPPNHLVQGPKYIFVL